MKKINFSDLILFEDINYVVINKPPFISSLEDRNDDYNILQMGREYFPEIQVCHRLDKNTSGCLVLAKTSEAYKHMAVQLQERLVLKSYRAVIDGSHVFNKEKITAPIYIKSGGAVKIDHRRGRMSETVINTLSIFKRQTLVECIPITGRLHQIRVHLASIGAPITGDTTYGGKPFYLSAIKPKYKQSKRKEELPLIRRFALHSYHISFTGLSGEKCYFEAPYPKDFKILLQQLKKYS